MRRTLFIGVFFAGFTSLAVELSASRLIGNYFGTSNLVWAVIIGLILIYLSIGYKIGGRWADRSPNVQTFFLILCWAGLAVGFIPAISRPVLKIASTAFDNLQIGLMVGTFLSVLGLFSIPVILLGTASPFAVRLALENEVDTGRIAGKLYSTSTLGSFLGTFFPVLILIPWLGTYYTFITLGIILVVVALTCLSLTVSWKFAIKHSWMIIVLLLLALFSINGPDKLAENLIFEDESAYNYIQVQEINGYKLLRLNEGQGIHSIFREKTTYYGGPWQQILVTPFFYPPETASENLERIAILGLAAGTSANLAADAFPDVIIDGYEIDPRIIDIGYRFFNMNSTQLNAYAQDARVGISNSPYQYDIVSIDAYRPPYIPWHLTTYEFFEQVFDHLSEKGGVVVNVARIFDDRRLVNSLYSTIGAIFPTVYIVDIPDTLNSILFATKNPTISENLVLNYINLTQDDSPKNVLILPALETAILNIQALPMEKQQIFTDDHAPIEWMMNQMIFDLIKNETILELQ